MTAPVVRVWEGFFRNVSTFLVGSLVLGMGLMAWSVPVAGQGQWEDVGAQVDVSMGNPIRSRRSPDATVQTTVTNVGPGELTGPLRLVVADLTPATVSLSGASGTTDQGEPYLELALPPEGLAPGEALDPLTLTIAGGGGTTFDLDLRVERLTPSEEFLTLQITEPPTLITVGASPILVRGTITPANASLTLNGAPVAHTGGSFEAQVNLEEGLNHIVARALDTQGGEVTDSVAVSMDLTPPYVTVESPRDGDVVSVDRVAVTGLVNDIVRGTISATEANVVVNGVPATVSNRTYLAANVPLQPGPNPITVTASDQVGNVGQAQVTVDYQPPSGPRIDLVSGQGQRGNILSELSDPLSVRLDDGTGNPVVGQNVVFRVIQGDGMVGVGTPSAGQAVLVATGADGVASTRFRLGARAGNGNHRVRASAVGYAGETVFYASADPNPGDKVSVIAGNNQRGAAGQPLPEPLIVAVTDVGSNLIAGAQVQFQVTVGGGQLQNGQATQVVETDSDGRASVEWTLGEQTGLDGQRVTATLVGTEAKAGFTASALVTGDPGQTRISGVVLDNQDNPLPGVTIRVDGTTREAVADAQGQFLITEVPVGPVHLLADGSTATVPGEWPTLSYNLVTVAGADNPLPAPIYMVKLDTANARLVGAQDVDFTLPEIPGFKLTVKAGSVTFPDGTHQGLLSVTPVNANKVPMPPPNGMQPQFIVTIQPAGARFDPPAPLTLPNVDGHLPGAQVEMYSYDHDLEEFVTIGLGTVSADGQVIASNPGVGVIKAGWHCGSQPGGAGCAHDCPICQDCDNDCNCVPKDGDPRLASLEVPEDCKRPECNNGSPQQVPDDSDVASDTNPGDCKKPGCNNGSVQQVNDDTDLPPDTPKDCKKPACNNGNPTQIADDTDAPSEECKECSGGSVVNKPDGADATGDPCLFCQSGTPTEKMGEIQGPGFVCPGATYNYSVTVFKPGATAVWGGDATGSGQLVVPPSAVDGDPFSISATVDSCTKTLGVSASDGRPGDTSETANCLLNPFDCIAINNLGNEALTWAQSNASALGGGLGGGCADAARHAYFNAIATMDIGAAATQDFLDAHEFSNFNGCDDNNMDLSNNVIGRGIGAGCTTRICAQQAVADALRNGDLVVWSGNATGSGSLVPSTVCTVTY